MHAETTSGPTDRPVILPWDELPEYVRQEWEGLATQLPIPPDTPFSGTSKVKLHELEPEQWERRIGRDPVLCAKVLAVANSAAMGQQARVLSVARAVLVLGSNLLQTILMAYYFEGLLGRWPKYPREHFDFVRSWSAASAVFGFQLARAAAHPDPQFVGTLALLARLGTLIIGLHWPAPGPEYAALPGECDRLRYELGVWGVTSGHLSMLATRHWSLPEPLPSMLLAQSLPLVQDCAARPDAKVLTLLSLSVALGAAQARSRNWREHLEAAEYLVLQSNAKACGLVQALGVLASSENVQRELEALQA